MVSTQDVNEASLQAEITAQKIVYDAKERLADVRLRRVTAIQEKTSLRLQILDIVQAREEVIQMFKNDITAHNPDIVDVGASLKASAPDSDIRAVWADYQPKVTELNQDMVQYLRQYRSLTQEIAALESMEYDLLDQYKQQTADLGVPVPSPGDLQAELVPVESVSLEDDASVFAQIPAIELLDPDTADMVMLEQADIEEQAATDQVMTMVKSADQEVDQIVTGVANKHTLIVGGLLLAYLLFK